MAKTKNTNSLIAIVFVLFLLLGGAIYYLSGSRLGKCDNKTEDERVRCLKENIDKFLDKKDIAGALYYLKDFQEAQQDITADCHALAHYIGEKAVPIIAQGVELEDADAGSICSHGFYHAFMASFNRLDKLPKAREFCDSLKSKEHGAKLNCYHGIGHGATFTAVEEFGIKDTEELVYSVRELCANTLENDLPKVYWCLDGLYSGLMDTARKDVYPDFVLLENPYDMCLSESEEEYKRLCYYDLGTYVVRRPGQEINPEDEEPFSYFVASTIRSPNVIYKRDAIKGLGASYFLRREKDQKRIDDAITYCQALPFEHKRACIEGMVWGIAEIPASGYHFEEASKLCDNGLFKEEERDICYLEIITKLGSIYSLEETIAYCNGFDKELYKNTCLETYENYEVSSAVNQELPTSYYAD